MGERKISDIARKVSTEDYLHKVMEILEAEDGRTFEEKKCEVIEFLKDKEDALLEKRVLEAAINDETGKCLKQKFWQTGDRIQATPEVLLRKVCELDRENYIKLQKENSFMKSMLKEESYQTLFWNEHIQDKSLMLTIEVAGEYAGYCGINNLSKEKWEISIELLKCWQKQGIGYKAIKAMLTELKERLNVNEFHIKVEPDNYASQKLFEKLGAVPYGIAEFMLHKEEDIIRCEEENMDAIDDKLVTVAEKFGVDPRKLLSHVLEYKLEW